VLGALAGKAFLLGLSTGLFCAGLCLPLVAPVLFARRKDGVGGSAIGVVLFLTGRLVAYLLVGLLVGLLGQALSRFWSLKGVILPIVYAVLGLLMLFYAFAQSFPQLGFCRFMRPTLQSSRYLLLLGFLAGINICPPFLLAIAAALDVGGVLRGVLFFLVFFVATSIYLVPLFFAGSVTRYRGVRIAARIAAALAGVYFVALAFRAIFPRIAI
jgi:sulfite exporter TauE/SafE